jgi:ribosomal protein S18 acetylase RimI-like enzyme
MNLTNRDFAGVDDLPIITRFFDEARELIGHERSPLHAGDVWWRYGRSEPETHQFQLWFEARKLIGIGWVIFGKNLELHLHPGLEESAFEVVAGEIVDWAKKVCPESIFVESLADNERFMRLLESTGFARYDYDFLMYTFDLKGALPDPKLPNGFEARHVLETEYPERVSVHRDAFDPSKFTLERYARVRSMPGYKSELDLVVSTPENTFASYCIVWLSNGVGEFEPVGTRSAFRRQGLGQAVILEGFRRLKALGAQTALVFSEPKNRAFYQSCGFRVVNQFVGFVFKPDSGDSLASKNLHALEHVP